MEVKATLRREKETAGTFRFEEVPTKGEYVFGSANRKIVQYVPKSSPLSTKQVITITLSSE